MRNLSTKNHPRFIFTLVSVSLLVLVMLNSAAYSQGNDEQQWWFNVELIVFKRILPPSNNENFDQAQFELNTSNANNLLYLAALKQASPYQALNFALPICDTKQNNNSKFAMKFDFEFDPNIANKLVVETKPDDSKSVTELSNETSVDEGQNDDVDAYVINRDISNQTLMADLLTPFVIEQKINEDEIGSMIDTLANTPAQNQNIDLILRDTRLAALDRNAAILNQEIQHNETIQTDIACLIAEPQEPKLTQRALSAIGPVMFSESSHFNGASQIISADESFMQDYAEKVLRQRDIQPLLYTAWRQQVEFGIENAEFYELRAGNLLESVESLNYEKWHELYKAAEEDGQQGDEETFFAKLKADLILNERIDWLAKEAASDRDVLTAFEKQKKYELEGQLKVFLDYVNQVPYLHIDSEFKHYRLALDSDQNTILQSFPLKQIRRVISKQIHYFDHPAFGLIVRLERFTPPIIEEVVIGSTNANQ